LEKDTLDWVGIDEAQFLNEDLIFSAILYMPHTNFLICGLNKDYLNRPFGFMGKILPYADEITLLKATCGTCKIPEIATRTIKLAGNRSKSVEVGSDIYQASCVPCYEKFRKNTTQ
jgi:thymidine kinase